MDAIAAALGFILEKISAAVAWIGSLVVAVFDALWLMFKDFGCWVLESILAVATTALGAFDFSSLTANMGAWAGLPANAIEVLAALGVSTALGMVATAIGIRLALQLIPFVRLGS
jgi:hypothetical protein